MSRKITEQDFLKRFYKNYPEAQVNIIKYTSIKKECEIQCNICGKIHYKRQAERMLSDWACCGKYNVKKIELVRKIYAEMNNEYEVIKQDKNPQYWIVRHNKCGNEIRRTAQGLLSNPCSCEACNTKLNKLSLSFCEAQEQIKERFMDNIALLEFTGVDKKDNKYRCLRCGLIFKTSQYQLINKQRGCPKCDKRYSKGEQLFENYLINHNVLNYKKQVRINGLDNLIFDFVIYNDDNTIKYIVEIQGDQHYRPAQWPQGFSQRQERDQKKRKFCKEKGYKLYELPWDGKILKNLDIIEL